MYNFAEVITVDNIENVGKMIWDVLKDKTYTFVASYEYKNFEPETRTNQRLENRMKNGTCFSSYNEDGIAGFHFSDTYGSWGLSTYNTDPTYDPTFKRPYVTIEDNKQITISQRTGANKVAHWQITVQE